MTVNKFICSAEDLKKIRKITGLTQTVFAQEIGLAGASAISMIEKGRAKPSGSTWFAVQKRFGHLFEILDKDGITYIEPKPQPALTVQEGGKEGGSENKLEQSINQLSSELVKKEGITKLDRENLEEAVFNMLKIVLRSTNEKAKAEVLSHIIMWRDLIISEEEKALSKKK